MHRSTHREERVASFRAAEMESVDEALGPTDLHIHRSTHRKERVASFRAAEMESVDEALGATDLHRRRGTCRQVKGILTQGC